jgi:alanine-synthesizing transaminase
MNKFQKIEPALKTRGVTYAIRDIITLANNVASTGKKMYYLNIGDPNVYDFDTPPELVDSVVEALRSYKNGYAPSSGIPSAIEAIRRDAEEVKGIKNIQDVFVTTGAAEAIDIVVSSLLNPGENMLTPRPGYPLYTALEAKLSLERNPYFLDESNGWQPDPDEIRSKINQRTRAILLINPNNPTGSVYSREVLEEIVEIAREYNLVILADEIYDKLVFDGEEEMTSIASLDSELPVVTFSGMSKNFMAPGWRLGWGIVSGREELVANIVDAFNRLLRSRVSANHPLMYAIPTALNGDQSHLEETHAKLRRRSQLTSDMINSIDGIDLIQPKGAFYAFPSIKVHDDEHFCVELLRETGVVVVPGSGFGQKPGENHFRIVICPTENDLREAYTLIGDFYKEYREKM